MLVVQACVVLKESAQETKTVSDPSLLCMLYKNNVPAAICLLPVNVHMLGRYIHGLLVQMCVFIVGEVCTDKKSSLSIILI